MTQALLKAVDRIGPLIEEGADSAEANRQLSGVVYEAMYQAGLFAMLAPKAYGGLELHPVEAMRVWEAVARIDSSAAWNLVMNQAISAYAAWLPAEGAREIFRHGPATTAGAFNPPGTATRADDGWRITGRVPFASGCHHAQWLSMPVVEMDERPSQAGSGDRAVQGLRGVLSARRRHDFGYMGYGRDARHGIDGLCRARSVCPGPADGPDLSARQAGAWL